MLGNIVSNKAQLSHGQLSAYGETMKIPAVSDNNGNSAQPGRRSDRVLLAQPSDVLRHSVRAMLEADGCSVIEAADGFTALSSLLQHEPDAVIADIMLSRLDGYQLCALIRNHAGFRNIPVILLATSEVLYDQSRAALVGSTAYVTRPFAGAGLGALVRGESCPLS